MHRSGTSALTRGLAALGVSLGDNPMKGVAGNNDKGFFEDLDIYHLNERLLGKANSAWHKLAPLNETSMIGADWSLERREAAALLARKLKNGPFGFKDPRTALLLPFWRCVFEDLNLDARYVIAVRNPLEVAASLEAREGIALTKGIALWATHLVSAVRHSEDAPRLFVAYERLLEDPLAELTRIAVALGLRTPETHSEAVTAYREEFLESDLRHNRIGPLELKRSGLAPAYVVELYEMSMQAAAGREWPSDAPRWRDIVSRLEDAAPLFAHADALDDERLSTKKDLDDAAAALRDANGLLDHARFDAQAAGHARDEADKTVAALRAESERVQAEAVRLQEESRADAEELRRRYLTELDELRREVSDLQARLRTGESERRDLLAESDKQLADLNKQRRDFAALNGSLREVEIVRLGIATELEKSRQDLKKLQIEAATADADRRRLAHDLEHSTKERLREADVHEQARTSQQAFVEAQTEQIGSLTQRFKDARRDMLLARAAVTEMKRSTSWRLTAPLRAAANVARNPLASARAASFKVAGALWRRLPMPAEQRGRLAARIFSAGRRLRTLIHPRPSGTKEELQESDPALEGYVPLLATEPPQSVPARVIAFYLPQFHPIPENDRWWGEGFTEWTKVKAGRPLFSGHYQPHEPGELGYYDLVEDVGVMRRQAELARLHGIAGFCFHFYWFGGQRLLEAPIQALQKNADIDMPYCLCWANENWTRRWDGHDNEILVGQAHSADDDIAFIAHVSQYFRDPRYIRIHDRPLLIVYRPALLPSAKETAQRWRKWLREHGYGEVYLVCTESFERVSPETIGFDASVEFPPNNAGLVSEPSLVDDLRDGLSIYDWRQLRLRAKRYSKPKYKLFRGVTPQWDNTPRRPQNGSVFVNTSPSAFSAWVSDAIRDTAERFPDAQERLVFINAWNEWAEGAHLEPDRKYGYAWLEAVRRAVSPMSERRKVIVVSHDLHRHGAQYLALNTLRTLRRSFGFEVATIAGESGALAPAFQNEGSLTIIAPGAVRDGSADAGIAALVGRGFRHAIVNSSASGWVAPLLARHGVKMIGLVHELPTIIKTMGLDRGLFELNRLAEALVFPAASVRDRDAREIGVAWRNAVILPQGLYKPGVVTDLRQKEEARRRIIARLDLPTDARIVVGVGYADERKGVDVFMAWAAAAKRWPQLQFVWVGAFAPEFQKLKAKLLGAGGHPNINFPGFEEDTAAYYAAADFYALSSREDPYPSTAIEALAAATPVITVYGTGGIEELENHGCVKVIANAEVDTFVAGAAEWVENRDAALAAGERGRNLVRERHGYATYVGALTDLLGLGAPNISVVVPNYNYAQHLDQRLKSILDQTLTPREIIFLDDCSGDDSVAIAERALADAPMNWSVVRSSENTGDVFAQWRKGVELAQGDIVWIAEADDWADPRFLETAVKAFRRDDVVLSMTQSQQADRDGQIGAADYLEYVHDVSPGKWTRAFVSDGLKEVREGLSIKNTIPNVSAVLFRRAALLEVLQTYTRDIASYRVAGDWCVYVNLLRSGALAFSPAALNYHRRHDASVTISKFDLTELAEIARMQAYVLREFAPDPEYGPRARAYLEMLVHQFGLEKRWARVRIEGAMRGVVAA